MPTTDFWIALALGTTGLVLLVLAFRTSIRRRREARWREQPPITLRHRVIMLHGILGFDKIGLLGVQQEYFRGIWRYLELLGANVSYPRVPMVGSIEQRAHALAGFIRSLDDDRVVLVAHSMGGLDARYAIHNLGLEDRVAALVTIGTPHRGTSLADLSGHTLPRLFRWGLARAGLDAPAVDGLTRPATAQFNETITDSPRVGYYSVVAAASGWTILFNPALWLTYLYVRWAEGPNDGLIAASSQRWGTVLDEIDADHWAQIGWTVRFDAKQLYEKILRELTDRGL